MVYLPPSAPQVRRGDRAKDLAVRPLRGTPGKKDKEGVDLGRGSRASEDQREHRAMSSHIQAAAEASASTSARGCRRARWTWTRSWTACRGCSKRWRPPRGRERALRQAAEALVSLS